MQHTTDALQFFITLNMAESVLSRKFDTALGGLSMKEFMILRLLAQEPDKKLRRGDLATKMGLTPAGVTRTLLSMEKVGYVTKDVNPTDARVSYVLLAPGGKRRLGEAHERAERLSQELLQDLSLYSAADLIVLLEAIARRSA